MKLASSLALATMACPLHLQAKSWLADSGTLLLTQWSRRIERSKSAGSTAEGRALVQHSRALPQARPTRRLLKVRYIVARKIALTTTGWQRHVRRHGTCGTCYLWWLGSAWLLLTSFSPLQQQQLGLKSLHRSGWFFLRSCYIQSLPAAGMTTSKLARAALLAVALLAAAPAVRAQGIWGPNGSSYGTSPSPYQAAPGSPVPTTSSPVATPAPPTGPSEAAQLAKPGIGSGCWFGVTKDFHSEPLSTYLPRTGLAPTTYNIYVDLPLDSNSTNLLSLALPQIAAQGAIVLLTVEPIGGLANVTYAAIGELAYYIKQFQQVAAKPRPVCCRIYGARLCLQWSANSAPVTAGRRASDGFLWAGDERQLVSASSALEIACMPLYMLARKAAKLQLRLLEACSVCPQVL